MAVENKLKFVKDFLHRLGVKYQINTVRDVSPDLFIEIYERIFNNFPEGIKDLSKSSDDQIQVISWIIQTLMDDVLHVSLLHIRPGDIVNGNENAIFNLLEVLEGIYQCLWKTKPSTETTDRNLNIKLRRTEPLDENKYAEELFKYSPCILKDSSVPIEDVNENIDMKYSLLRKQIDTTKIQVENLSTIANEALQKIATDRDRYLQEKIKQVIVSKKKVPMVNSSQHNFPADLSFIPVMSKDRRLQEYVDDHRDNLVLIANKYSKSNSKKRSNRPKSDRGRTEDDLTMITLPSQSNRDDTESVYSRDTYTLSPRDDGAAKNRDSRSAADFLKDMQQKNAWADVNKDIIQNGYESQFIDMLLDEEDKLNRMRNDSESKNKMLKVISNHPSESVFDYVLGNDDLNNRKCLSARSNNRSKVLWDKQGNRSFVKPVIKHIQHKTKKVKRRSDSLSSTANNYLNKEEQFLTKLLDEFPGLQLSEQTLSQMWSEAARQTDNMNRAQNEYVSKMLPIERKVEDARKRQKMLTDFLRKDALHEFRIQEKHDERKAVQLAKSTRNKQRQQSARIKRYNEEFSIRMRQRMVQKQAKEEQIFRKMFAEALKIQKERVNDMRQYMRDMKKEQFLVHEKDIDSLENYYRDRFAMLAEALRKEREKVEHQDKFQEMQLRRLKTEMRRNYEIDIRTLQDSMIHSQHEYYFRELDAENILSDLSKL